MLAIIMVIEDEQDRLFVETLYQQHAKKMYKIANGILHHKADAEDVVHDTIRIIIECLEKYKHAQEQDYLIKLIVITCRNVAIQKYRKKVRQNNYESFATPEANTPFGILETQDNYDDMEQLLISEENCQLLHDLIGELDEKYRDILSLRVMGFDYETIAKIMGIRVELVRQRIIRARKKLLEMGGHRLYEIYKK